MYDAVASALIGRAREPEGLRRMIGISIGAHILLMAAIVVLPNRWFQRPIDPTRDALMISLGGAPGPVSGGMTPLGAKPVQQAMRDLPKMQPLRPPAQKTPEMTEPDRTLKPVKPKAVTPVHEAPKEARSKTPTTGAQEQAGRTMAETGSQSTNTLGLSTGGGGTGGSIQLANFCCPEYIGEMVNRINQNWNSRQQTSGITTMRFTIQRDGHITDISIAQSSGYQMLDFLAQRAVMAVNPLPPLPEAYTNSTLTLNIQFEYHR